MAKILTYFRLRNLTLLQSIILFTTAYLAIVLTAIGFEFGAIERVRGRMADQAASTGWVLTAQILAILLTVGIGLVAMASLFTG